MKPTFHAINKYNMPFAPGKDGDVGHDLHAMIQPENQTRLERLLWTLTGKRVMVVWPFRQRLVPSGIYLNLDGSTWCQIVARSSAARRGFLVITGIIDSGYQGELYTSLYNFTLLPKFVRKEERYSQVIFFPAVRPYFKKVPGFKHQTQRGSSGFGSTGA
jgi:dUTP pyrophosphatase